MTTSIENPYKDFEINAMGALNLLDSIRKYSPETAVFFSSTNKVYGDLENYTYEDVKKSVLSYAASNKFFPDLADLTGGLTPISAHEPEPERRDKPMCAKEQRDMEKSIRWQKEWHEHLRGLGLPTFREATMGGMDPGEYTRLLCSKGAFDG